MKTRNEILRDAFEDRRFLNDYLSFEDVISNEFEDAEELSEIIQQLINEKEVIYYSEAIKFLSVNDPSLQDSLQIAYDFSYTTEQLNSELLATLLLQNILSSELYEFIEELEDENFFND